MSERKPGTMTMSHMTIGEAAAASGVSAKMIRYYENIGLIPPAVRAESGYRHYTEADAHTLKFVRQARDLGFSIDDIARLLSLWRDRRRPSSKVKALVQTHVRELRKRVAELEAMAQTLEHLARHCHGDDRPDCPILDDLASDRAPRPRSTPRKGNRHL